ncbi:cell surface protein SprA [Bacteroides sp. 214]|uniref:T9SS outer membrane translocon Sov/SprA n=1 Tax=Bacteroides sp. 214 TaxID=2302935 RepID=UPI0013D3D605|nr:cell surface protein SprA [Bacteroides sp. 214]NDW11770.1 cell surface protein SprA [Bacteroides sp. 214]
MQSWLLRSLLILLFAFGVNSFSAIAQTVQPKDSIPARFPVSKTVPSQLEDLNRAPADFKTPENVRTVVEYDAENNMYRVCTKIGDVNLAAPILLTPEEYANWKFQQQMNDYFRRANSEQREKGKDAFDFTDMNFNLGPAEKIFGPGGVQIQMQGSAELSFGMNYRKVDNPTLSSSARKSIGFDFEEKINTSITGKVGDKVNLDLNYNTDATFDFDTKKIKLSYEGKEDEIIKLLEGGNVSMPTNGTLIRGASSLFGIRADLQFGKLKLQTVVSQQESESKTVTSKGGSQTTPFEFSADKYDENRHFFLAHYFRDNYDNNMSKLPTVLSGVSISRVEVWVTNKRSNYDNPRNVVALVDLGEGSHISNSFWHSTGGLVAAPFNDANNLYQQMVSTYAEARDISKVTGVMTAIPGIENGNDFEKIESARLLTSSEYTLNTQIGYLSLKQSLQPDEVLAVAFEYTLNGKRYQVGEFSSDIKDTKSSLYVKLLKNTSNSPDAGCWDLMMKNVYALGANQIQRDKFRLDITYQSDTAGVYLKYIPEGAIDRLPLLRVMNLDRLNSSNQSGSDGLFDFVEGYTVLAQNGRIYFPVVEPFGSHLRKMIGNDAIADKYVFEELYDSTLTVARQIAEKNKFRLQGEYRGSSGSEIRLGSMNIPAGSVVVTAGGVTLTENSDYTIDYNLGVVTIINQNIIDAGTAVSVNLESNTLFNMQRKTMMGLNFTYDYSKDFQFGGTILHLKEKPLVSKVAMGDEPISNTLWGVNFSWKKESQWLTNMLDKLPFVNATQPSQINLTGEFAHLMPGTSSDIQSNASYIDDFETTQSGIDLRQPSYWMLASTPYSKTNPLFPEAEKFNDIEYGKNRALLAWYYIDRLFTRRNSSLTPTHIKNDVEQLSNHYVREVYEQEVFPNKEITNQESSTISILNLAYYPEERGPYNLDTHLTSDGKLLNPDKRWGGMMRKLDTSDFESSNIEYIEFWLLDPFLYENETTKRRGGDLYINLGEISEDILKDGKKFFENGLPTDGDVSKVEETVWGRVPKERSIVYAFDNSTGSRRTQDVGLNGLSTEDERNFPTYNNYLSQVSSVVTQPEAYQRFYEDPAADNYHYFRGSDYDQEERSILERYKYYNNTEGNSIASEDSPERYDTSAKTVPDVEDINQDNTLNETEKYFQYQVSIRPEDMRVGSNYISDVRKSSVKLRNGNTEEVSWYQFKIPVKSGTPHGSIKDFKSIRFMRMFMTDFEQPVVLRFATLELVRGEWRSYTEALYNLQNPAPTITGTLGVSTVNIEENGDRTPVNYVLPPGISRVIDPGQPQLRQQNEQALSLKVTDLAGGDARAVYKNTGMDMRQYKRLQMFVHAEEVLDDMTNPEDGELAMFIRLGSDYRSNYYEYEIPLKLTPHGSYSDQTLEGRLAVWPEDNMLDIPFTVFTNLKKARNADKNDKLSDVSFATLYYDYDPDKPANRVSVIGNPSLAEVKTIMVGVRNNARSKKSVEIWLNELRLTEFNEEGGWAARGNLNVQLSDLGSVNLAGHVETAGFGGLEQSVSERRLDDYYQYNFTTSMELGRFLPAKAKISAPIYYSYSREITSPKYNPLDKDMLLDDALDALDTKHEKDSLKSLARELATYKNFSLSNMKVNVASKNPMPYDPANFTLSYAYTQRYNEGSTTAYENEVDWRASLSYNYSPTFKAWEPMKNMKSKSPWLKFFKEFNLNWIPQSISFNTDLTRHYYELQTREVESTDVATEIPVSFAKEFFWNRDLAIRWDLSKNLQMNYTSATRAEIEEPYVPVNKDLYPNEYEIWKDSVKRSLASLGRPLDYKQTFNLNYKLPFDKFPLTDWITADTRFSSSYNWDRGVSYTDMPFLGNTIANQRSLDLNTSFKLENLYNKVPFLKEVNRKFASTSRTPARPTKPTAPKKIEREIELKPDTTVLLEHKLATKNPKIVALTTSGRRYPVRYKVLNPNAIRIENRDSIRIKVTVVPGPRKEDQTWYKTAQSVSRFAMMVRSISATYKNTFAMTLPGFIPEVGDAFGQTKNYGVMAPGLDFAFGLTGNDYIEKAIDKGWLMQNDSVTSPATTNAMQDLQLRMTLEPFRDMKIDLNAGWTRNKSREVQFMYEDSPELRSGSLNMTVLTIGSAFESSKASNGYSSKTFDRFLKNLDVIQQRVEAKYIGATYPAGTSLAGQPFDPANGTVNKYSPEVMMPAFLAAYTGRSGKSASLDIFPDILSIMPNWRVTYSGLSKLAFFKKHFKSVNINHAYRSTYSIGSYSTFQSFMSYMGDIGFIEDVQTGDPMPSSMYDVSMVSINEQFSPLLGVDLTLHSGINFKAEYKTTRVVNLSMAAYQLSESSSNDLVFGMGYKILNFQLFKGRNTRNSKKVVSNDLTLRADISFRNQSALSRNIQMESTQATSGNEAFKLSCTADYVLSKMLTLRVFYDMQRNKPLVSATSYPVTTADFGVSMRFSLTR